jgi:opacity protein-like surface antigen
VLRTAVILAALLLPAVAGAQTEPGPPGPYVLDLRGAMLTVPNAAEFYPGLPLEATIPGRAFGLDVGAHVLPWQRGTSRVGLGANMTFVRGVVGPPDVSLTALVLAPQISLNFGSRDGWSYIGAGYGPGRIRTRVAEPVIVDETDGVITTTIGPETAETGTVGTLNLGGGARWFVTSRLAVGFDVRFYRFGGSSALGSPATSRLALSVGMSVR